MTTLLSWAWIAHTIEIDNAFEAASADRVGRHVRISLPMWTNGLRHIDEDGVAVDQVRVRARATCNMAGWSGGAGSRSATGARIAERDTAATEA